MSAPSAPGPALATTLRRVTALDDFLAADVGPLEAGWFAATALLTPASAEFSEGIARIVAHYAGADRGVAGAFITGEYAWYVAAAAVAAYLAEGWVPDLSHENVALRYRTFTWHDHGESAVGAAAADCRHPGAHPDPGLARAAHRAGHSRRRRAARGRRHRAARGALLPLPAAEATMSTRNGPEQAASPLAAEALRVGYGERSVLDGLDLEIAAGTVTTLVGPNGSGKSTLLKALARLIAPSAGAVYLDGTAISRLPSAEVARRLAILPQGPVAPEGLTVRELVEQGRFPHVGALRMLGAQDHQAISSAMEHTGMAPFAHQPLDALSGGERQRAWIALALAQATPVLLLDEPTTFLDIGHQLEVLDLVRQLNRERGMTIVLVLHDLNQAARYSDRMVALLGGQIVADGDPAAVLTPALLERVFGVRANIVLDPASGTPVCLPYAVVGAATEPTLAGAAPRLALS